MAMPPSDASKPPRTRAQVVERLGVYPPQAIEFIERALSYTVQKVHGRTALGEERHVSGAELCWGLRDYAQMQWGLMAPVVLRHWNITCTMDFGRIVYALIDGGLMQKREEDSIEDFRDVYRFDEAFDQSYKIGCSQ